MRLTLSPGICALLVACTCLIGAYAQSTVAQPDFIASAIADPARPEGDRTRDVVRKPAESLQFSGLKPGEAVADFNAGSGYFTRLFSDVVGNRGHVYAIEPVEIQQYIAKSTAELRDYAAGHPNITVSVQTALDSLHLPRKLDLFWISQNYHDLHNKYFGPLDMAAFNKAVQCFEARRLVRRPRPRSRPRRPARCYADIAPHRSGHSTSRSGSRGLCLRERKRYSRESR